MPLIFNTSYPIPEDFIPQSWAPPDSPSLQLVLQVVNVRPVPGIVVLGSMLKRQMAFCAWQLVMAHRALELEYYRCRLHWTQSHDVGQLGPESV